MEPGTVYKADSISLPGPELEYHCWTHRLISLPDCWTHRLVIITAGPMAGITSRPQAESITAQCWTHGWYHCQTSGWQYHCWVLGWQYHCHDSACMYLYHCQASRLVTSLLGSQADNITGGSWFDSNSYQGLSWQYQFTARTPSLHWYLPPGRLLPW